MNKSSNRTFFTHAVIYGIGTLLLQAASILLLPLYTRYLTPVDFGVLEILSRTGQVVGILLMANGITTATFAFYCQAKTPDERDTVAATVTTFVAIVLMCGGLLVVALARPLGYLIGVDDPTLTALGILAGLFDCATVIPMCLAQSRTESLYYVCASLTIFVCRVLLITAVVVGFGWGIWGILSATITTGIMFGAILNVREFWGKSFRPDMTMLSKMARFALPFVPGGLCFFVFGTGDRFFLVKCAGHGELGVYALACKLAGTVGLLSFTPLFKVWSARMYDAFALPNSAEVVGRAITRMLAAYVFVGLGLCIFVDVVVRILATPAYVGATAMVALIVLGGLFSTAATLMDGVFYAQRRTGLKPWIAVASMTVMCSLYACLIPRFGAMGAAYAVASGYLFHAIATWAVSRRIIPVKYEFERIAVMLATAVLLVILSHQIPTGAWDIPAKVALCAAWPLALWMGGLVAADEKAIAARLAQKILRQVRSIFRRADLHPAIPPPRL